MVSEPPHNWQSYRRSVRLAVHEFGSGDRTAAIVHGISGSGLLWQDFAERLSRRHGMRVLAVDLRGHGSSPRSEHYRLRDFTDDLVETLPTDLDLAIGHSLGGRALADAAERLQPHRAIYLDPALDVDAGVAGRRLLTYRMAGPVVARMLSVVDPAVPAPLRRRLRASTRRWDRFMALSVVQELDAHRVEPAAPPVPSTIVKGDEVPASSRALPRATQGLRLGCAGIPQPPRNAASQARGVARRPRRRTARADASAERGLSLRCQASIEVDALTRLGNIPCVRAVIR